MTEPDNTRNHAHTHHNDHEHHHSHHAGTLSGKKIFWVTVLNATITTAEIIGGLVSGSLALLSDALHNLSDTIAIALSYVANRIGRRPKDPKRTYGYQRAEIIAAFVNSLVLMVMSVFLVYEAVKRFGNPQPINGVVMIAVAAIGLVANAFSVLLLEKDSHGNLNIRSGYLHLLGDTISSVGVLAGGIVVNVWNIVWVDPLVTILIAVYIVKEAVGIIAKATSILMQTAAPLDYQTIKKAIEAMDSVKNIHHIHSWMADEHTVHFEAHIELDDMMLSQVEQVCARIEEYLVHEQGVNHVTLQAEVDRCCDKGMFHC